MEDAAALSLQWQYQHYPIYYNHITARQRLSQLASTAATSTVQTRESCILTSPNRYYSVARKFGGLAVCI